MLWYFLFEIVVVLINVGVNVDLVVMKSVKVFEVFLGCGDVLWVWVLL